MTNKCGQCRQFTRVKSSDQDICGAWGHPTCATRIACEFLCLLFQRNCVSRQVKNPKAEVVEKLSLPHC
nr:hypothetical protein [Vibrio parahaemolyticus]